MGLGDFLLKKTAKSTANSIAKYVNSGTFSDADEALKAWASTRRQEMHLVSLIDSLTDLTVANQRMAGTAQVAEALFYSEMDLEKSNLSPKVSGEIRDIFDKAL
jgi:hypothetical protein